MATPPPPSLAQEVQTQATAFGQALGLPPGTAIEVTLKSNGKTLGPYSATT
jgi:hypothetical protein